MNSARVNLLNLSAIMSQNNDRTYYACFLAEDCRTNPTDSRFFTFSRKTGTNECVCQPADGAILKGKITIPTIYNGMIVTELSDFGTGYTNTKTPQEITHIYWYNVNGIEPQLKSIASSAFRSCTNLIYIDIPNTIEIIQDSAFRNCISLKMIDFSNFKKLETISDYAFNGAFGNMEDINLHFSGKTKNFGQYSFAYLNSKKLGRLQFGDIDDPVTFTNNITIALQSFLQAPGDNFQYVTFYYNSTTTNKETALVPLFNELYMSIAGAQDDYIDVA